MKASSYFGGQYLSAADLDGKTCGGKIVAITSEVLDGRDGREREKMIIHIEGVEKPVVCNATNGDRLISAWGDETDAWIGHMLSLTKGKVMFNGKRVDSIVMTPASP